MLTKQMVLDGLQYYRWQTEYPLFTTTDSMDDFIENHLPDDYEVIERDMNYIVAVNDNIIFIWDIKGFFSIEKITNK